MCIKWGQSTSGIFTVSNGVRQGGILSPRLFAVYVDDLSKHLHDARSGCFIGHQCINHVMYADDICLLAPSALGLQKLFNYFFLSLHLWYYYIIDFYVIKIIQTNF